jgi:hypothetical protein
MINDPHPIYEAALLDAVQTVERRGDLSSIVLVLGRLADALDLVRWPRALEPDFARLARATAKRLAEG